MNIGFNVDLLRKQIQDLSKELEVSQLDGLVLQTQLDDKTMALEAAYDCIHALSDIIDSLNQPTTFSH